MTRKTLILILLFQFLVTSFGFPVTIDYCMMKKTTSTDKMCPMCKNEIRNLNNHSSANTNQEIIKSICCITKTVDLSIKDKFIKVTTEAYNNVCPLAILNFEQNQTNIDNVITSSIIQDHSPPYLNSNHIYKSNSTFLI